MAAIYWRGDDRAGAWWIKFYPKKGADAMRASLDTVDHCRAELIQRRVELEVELRRPELSGIELPQSILNALNPSSPEAASRKTKKHYREAFHALFEFAMKYTFFIPINFRYPNPMSALPTYHEKNRRIIFLTNAEVDHLLELLKPFPSVRVAVALMIFGGLRRAEALWLQIKDISQDLRFFSVINKVDAETDIESRLKTGERPVPILPPLKAILEEYLPTLETEWLVPSPTGLQWIGDNFGDKHRAILRDANLRYTCLHYRHTFATDRAKEGWSLFRIAKTMGNSIAVCEEYYAAFIDPSLA
ncbi:MAG: tyrosine-type recombinase/integrase [Verrucomicrobiota bacterium]